LSCPRSPEHPDDETFPGLLLLRPEGTVYFGSARRLGQQIQAHIAALNPKVVALDLSAVPEIEYTALRMLMDGEEKFRSAGIMLWLVALNPDTLTVVQHSPLGTRLGRERMFLSLDQAVAKYQQQAAESK